jgi:hypothetical protein
MVAANAALARAVAAADNCVLARKTSVMIPIAICHALLSCRTVAIL